MHEAASNPIASAVDASHQRCVRAGYEIHARLAEKGLIIDPHDLVELIDLVQAFVSTDWDEIDELTKAQEFVVGEAKKEALNEFEVFSMIGHVLSFSISGVGTVGLIARGDGEAPGEWLGHSMS